MLQNTKSKSSVLRNAVLFAVGALLLSAGVMAQNFEASRIARDLNKLNRFVQSGDSSKEAAQAFKVGRDLLAEEKWAQAQRQFSEFIKEYPNNKDVDAALYWMAFALKKQNRLSEADATIERLLRDHQKSKWRDDAEAMRLEIAPQLGKRDAINQAISKEDEDMKMIALQSLFQANPERAMEITADLLKPDSKASPRLRETALHLLAQSRSTRATDTLIGIARNTADPKMREKAVFYLGQSRDERVLDLLKDIATKESGSVAEKAAFAISQHRSERAMALLVEIAKSSASPKVRQQAIFGLGQRRGEQAVDELVNLYNSEKDSKVRQQIIFAISQTRSEKARAKLLELAKNEKDVAARKQAIFGLTQIRGAESVSFISQLYDTEQDPEIKEHLLHALSESHSKEALNKLMQIARTDPSLKNRKTAVFRLGQSRDPEVLKFLEELLK